MSLLMKTFFLLVMSYSLTACDNNRNDYSRSEQFRKDYARFKTEMSRDIDKLDKKVEAMRVKMSGQDKAIKKRYEAAAQEFSEMKNDISAKLEDMEDVAKDKYVDLKSNVKTSYEKMRSKIEKITN